MNLDHPRPQWEKTSHPSVFQKSHSGIYYRYYRKDGKPRWQSLKTKVWSEAVSAVNAGEPVEEVPSADDGLGQRESTRISDLFRRSDSKIYYARFRIGNRTRWKSLNTKRISIAEHRIVA